MMLLIIIFVGFFGNKLLNKANLQQIPYTFDHDAPDPSVIKATGVSFSTIDAMVFTDTDGKRYMYWGSAFKPILAQQLSDDGLSLVGEPKEVLFPTFGNIVDLDTGEAVKDNYEGLIEAPWVLMKNTKRAILY
jgi:beta-xylosidase